MQCGLHSKLKVLKNTHEPSIMIANYNNATAETQHQSVNTSNSSMNSSFDINQNEPPAHLFEHLDSDDYYASLAAELPNQEYMNAFPIDFSSPSIPSNVVPSENGYSSKIHTDDTQTCFEDQQESTISENPKPKKTSKTKKTADSDLSSCAVDREPPKTSGSALKANTSKITTTEKKSVYPPKFVVQQNRLLEAFKDLNIFERRLFLYLSTIVRIEVDKNPEQDTFLVNILDFARTFKLDRGNHLYEFMRKSGKEIQKKSFEYKLEKDGYVDDVDVNFAFRFRYRPATSQMWVSLSSEVIEMLTVFDSEHPFTRYELNDVIRMKNINSITLFELLIRFRKVGKRSLSIEYMRKVFQCEDKYPKVTDFIRYVVKKSAQDITDFTDYKVDVIIDKNGGGPVGATFTFKNFKRQMQKKGKELALVDFYYTSANEISKHNMTKVVKLKRSQLHRIVSRKVFVNDYPVSANSEHNQSGMAYINHMIDRLIKDASFVKKHTLDYYLEQHEDAFP